ncbi:MAG: hypothetical protein ABS43_22840 [Bordetella sp. SCN 67-23]|nr:tripartite tricarboxylate transporter substrate binding protein [Burkholderiales bacterium]ODS70463.1 MAG: hypothetical protein ABS43_22840 [Bordetella sp. SCN 67-23]ODU62883.1 MAG: hypothetical protein ABT00_23475 [Bordetella sp. SCN 68-11]OJW94198.1 MAG: hypothetical protein BGO71_01835 [Burkholderiales bacterium 67-32]
MNVRRILARVAALVGCAAAGAAHGEAFPARMVRIVVPFTAGGLADVVARGVAQELTTRWSQPVIVENKPGANTIIAAEHVARAAPDGYTLLMANDPTLSSNQYLYRKLSYDPVKDFVPVVNLVQTREILLASRKSGLASVEALVARAKARPGEVTYGSYGVGSKAQLDAETFSSLAGIRLNHVPYKGVADVMAALVGGQIDVAWVGVPPAIPMVEGDKVRLLAVAAPRRITAFPAAPTFAELGFPKMVSQAWFGLVAPRDTPDGIVGRIAADVSAVVSQPAFLDKYVTGVGLEPLNQGPEEFGRFLARDRAEYETSIRNAKVKLD